MSAQSYKEAVIVKIIRSIDGRTEIEDAIGYSEPKLIIDIGDDDFFTKRMYQSAGIGGENVFIAAGSAWPAVLVKGVDFLTEALRPSLSFSVSEDATTDTNNGTSFIYHYNFTDATKTELASITVDVNTIDGTTVEQDTWVRVV